uniref:AB hydrolase-1 domain-containing protein n=1 Tax=Heliothis virescens TaxID=7102 RepID=A0A2A4JFX9_HELVI
MTKPTEELTVDATWGKIAMVSWGNPAKPPMLLVHGYMDSAATFTLLVEQLPDTHYYVALDMPGHGKSDPFPPGLLVSHLNIVEVIRLIVKQMDWKNFVYMSHSMGFVIGILYNHLFPGKITKMIHIDPAAPISMYYYVHNTPQRWYQHLYDTYYSGYHRWNAGSTRRLTLDEAVNLLVRNRSISENQAEVVLSRALVPDGEGKFKLSWETRMKQIASAPISEETFYTVMTQHAPPMLIVEASEDVSVPPGREFAASILEKCRLMLPNFHRVTVTGGHDVHITHPESIAPHVEKFLKPNKDCRFLKLSSRGHPDGEPVLCIHGRQDSSSVFDPVLNMMPNTNHYVCLDMPGNGLSDGLPPGFSVFSGGFKSAALFLDNVSAPSFNLPRQVMHYAELFHIPPIPKKGFIEFHKKRQMTYMIYAPDGPKMMRFHFLMAMELAIAHLGWDQFIFIGHSMGCEQGLFFNAIHPNRITKMVLLDANPTLMRMQVDDPADYHLAYFDTYYENFHKENFERKSHTRLTARRAMARARDLTDKECAHLLERNFHPTSDAAQWHPIYKWHPSEAERPRVGVLILNEENSLTAIIEAFNDEERAMARGSRYEPCEEEMAERLTDFIVRNQLGVIDKNPNESQVTEVVRRVRDDSEVGYLSWDNRLKNLAPTNFGNDYYFELFKTIPPTLLISASDGAKNIPRNNNWREGAKELLDKMATLENFHRVDVEGGHDVHFTHPERVAPYIIKFLENKVNSKL